MLTGNPNGSLTLAWTLPSEPRGTLDAFKYDCVPNFDTLAPLQGSVDASEARVLVQGFPSGVQVLCSVSAHTASKDGRGGGWSAVVYSNVGTTPSKESKSNWGFF